jgi:hypothetical protein
MMRDNDVFGPNYETRFVEQARQYLEDETDLDIFKSITRVASEWLGYDIPEERFIDSAGDRGIDFWHLGDAEFDIFQVKTHQIIGGMFGKGYFDNDGVNDLLRARAYLLEPASPPSSNEKLRDFRSYWDYEITSHGSAGQPVPIIVNLYLLLIGGELTPQAQDEYDAFAQSLQHPSQVRGVPIEFRTAIFGLNDLITNRWKEDNRKWEDKNGAKKDYIDMGAFQNSGSKRGRP